jgi:hypothetical protein
MKKYWFYGIMPRDAISENTLTEEQKQIIKEEKEKLNEDNLQHGWLGYNKEDSWVFMRHGFEEIIIDEPRGNIARKKFTELLPKLFMFEM